MRVLSLAVLLLAGCAVHHRATDPAPTVADSTTAGVVLPTLVDQSTVPVSVVLESTPAAVVPELPAVSTAAAVIAPVKHGAKGKPAPVALAPAAKPRLWGRVAITTAIVSPSQLVGPEVPFIPDYKSLPAFPEKITLAMSWGMLSVGEATLTVNKIVMFNGRPAYHLVNEARSNSFCDTFYPVRDLNESWLDARTLTSLGYSKKVREGHFFRDEWTLYDRDAGTFVQRRVGRDGNFAVRVGTIPAKVQDVLSSIYYVRAQQLADGGEVVVDVNTPDNWPLVVKVTGREEVKAPLGKFKTVLVEPMMRREGLFVQKGKRLRLWLSDDGRRAPVMMKVEVFFGHVTAALKEML